MNFCGPYRENKVFISCPEGKKKVYAARQETKNASDRMFITLAFASDDNLHAIWDILYFPGLGA